MATDPSTDHVAPIKAGSFMSRAAVPFPSSATISLIVLERNVFVNSTNATYNWDVVGSDNWIQTTMEDGADNSQTVGVTGDYNYIFVGQNTGSTSGITNNAILDATFSTTHSDINIIQSDAN